MLKVFIVGAGGFIGSASRYLLGMLVYKLSNGHAFPFSTLTVNVIGCFLIGFIIGLSEVGQNVSVELHLFLVVGLLGGFTTFSSFGHETMHLFRGEQNVYAFLNIAVSIIFCLGCAWLGHYISKLL